MKILSKLLFLILTIPTGMWGQGFDAGEVYDTLGNEARTEISLQALSDLKNGVLVVRLKTGSNKLKALERVANSPTVSTADKIRFESKIAEHKTEIRKENDNLIRSLQEHYTFSGVLYIADTSIHLLKDGAQSGFFLNEEMQEDPTISLQEKPYLVAYYGSTISPTKNGEEGLVVMDSNLQELVEPFPYFTGLTTTRKLLLRFWSQKDDAEYFNLMVERFNKKLEKFAEAVNE